MEKEIRKFDKLTSHIENPKLKKILTNFSNIAKENLKKGDRNENRKENPI